MSTIAVVPSPTPSVPPPGPVAVAKAAPAAAKAQVLMDVVVSRESLIAELAAALSMISTKTTIPILGNLLLEANGDRLTITGTNLEHSLRTSAPARTKTPGAATVPARKFFDYLRLLPNGDINIKLGENGWVGISAGRSRTKMVGMDRANYPEIQTPNGQPLTKIAVSTMKTLISRTAFAVSNEESRYTLRGALFLVEPTGFTMVATDGHRLALAKRAETVEGVTAPIRVIVPQHALIALQSLLSNTHAETISFAEDASSLFFQIGQRAYASRKLSGSFPNYAAVIPTQNTKKAILRTLDVEHSVRRVEQFADERSGKVLLSLGKNMLRVSSKSDLSGQSEDVIETPYAHDPVDIGLNSTYLLEFLKAVGGTGEFVISLKDGQSACLFEPEAQAQGDSYLYLIMPMRV
jgi:DNA polymerase-3 subunit beta